MKTNLGLLNDGLTAAGTVAGAGELFTNANAGARITYTTINGARAWVSAGKVVTALKTVGSYTFYGSIVIDGVLTISGSQDLWKTTCNTFYGGAALVIGGIPGIVIGVGYVVLDKTGMLDGPTGPFPPINPYNTSMPDATIVAPGYRK